MCNCKGGEPAYVRIMSVASKAFLLIDGILRNQNHGLEDVIVYE